MAGRVNLNVPPRLIESARAAQYANREVQSAAEQARRLRGKVQQRQEAARRAQPQAQAADRRGGVFDAPAINRAPRIWRRRRALAGYKYGTAYLTFDNSSSGFAYRISSPDGNSNLLFNPPTTTSPITPSPGHLSAAPAFLDIDGSSIGNGIGGNGSRYVMRHSPVSRLASELTIPGTPLTFDTGFERVYVESTTQTASAANWAILPAGGTDVVIVYSHYFEWLDFYFDGAGDPPNYAQFGPGYPWERLALGSGGSGFALTQRAFYVSESIVKEISVGAGFRDFTENALNASSELREETEIWYNSLVFPPQYLGKLRFPSIPEPPAPLPGGGATFDVTSRTLDYYSMVRFGDLNSGGVASLLGYGPGIYSYLANPSAANAAVDAAGDGPWAKQAAAEQFIGANLLPDGSLSDSSIDLKRALLYQGEFPPPGRSVSVVPNSGNSLYRYALLPTNGKDDPLWELQDDEIKDSVITGSSSAPRVPLYQTPPILSTDSASSYTYPILFWDWDNPDYCRRQLLNLGFSEADLTP